jgi:hypothetical protein
LSAARIDDGAIPSRIASSHKSPFGRFTLLAMTFAFVPLIGVRAQLSHVDSTLVQSLAMLTTTISAGPFVWSGDTNLYPLLSAMPTTAGTCLPVFYIDHLSATVDSGSANKATMKVDVDGSLLRPSNPVAQPHTVSRSLELRLTANDWTLLETNADRFVHLNHPSPPTFWSNVLEPGLVVLGGIVIVALFFLIRS